MSGARIRLVEANPLTSVQDAGRRGAMRYGVSQSGPMDWVRFRLATALAGAPPGAFEVGLAGARFLAEGPVAVAVAGPGFEVRVGEVRFAAPVRLTIPDGAELAIVPGRHGMWAYVAVAGIDLGAPLLGSYATNVRTGLGARDLSAWFPCDSGADASPALFADPYDDDGPVGVLPGPQHHMFDAASRDRFVEAAWRITDQVDRMGYRLDGPGLSARRHDIVSDGVVEGAVQVPGNGLPIVLMADRQPTGGYPKLAVLAAVDRPRLAQRRPGDTVRFEWTDAATAAARRRAIVEATGSPAERVLREIDPTVLATRNLVSGVWPAASEGL
ncbi:biotin-dependent carboxyltransferase family protein [Acuticoccus sp.]|uniref:5-oxoprolinase subunit C family protein n=1 Tax=Acuticoccus sp. TaxID=1904378 RepID=UPI003B5189CB